MMDIRKADSKGRVTVGDPETHYFSQRSDSGIITLRPVPPASPGTVYESEEVSAAKDAVWDILDSLEQKGLIDAEEVNLIATSDKIVTTLIELGWCHRDDYADPITFTVHPDTQVGLSRFGGDRV